jgi:isopentenyl diphosphate isomerase/L-lactate dehydrogenase-like FMN-dependent dehydrogenase
MPVETGSSPSAPLLASPRWTSATPAERVKVEDEPSVDLGELVSVSDFEAAARGRLPNMAWEYFNGGAADELTLRWNHEAYDRLRLRPRVLVDVSTIDTRVRLLGLELAHPILLAPAADHRMVHPDGELATARGAGSAEALFVVSSFTNTPIEEIAKRAAGPLWFQLYVQRDRAFTRDVIQRAAAAGCTALCVTVDSPTFGARNLDTVPATADVLPAIARRVAGRVPVLVDGGIRRGTDVVKALALGATAVLVGRPYLYGLAVAGEAGVARVIEILRNELQMAMGLLGRPTIGSLDGSILWDLPPGGPGGHA